MYPWYIEAKKHVGLKEIPGIKHNPVILGWLKSLKAWWSNDEEAWCFPGDVEILTEDGWVQFKSYNKQKVYQVNDQGSMSLTNVIKIIEKDYNGLAYHIKTRSVDVVCDAGHKWWGYWGGKNNKNFDTLDNINEDGLFIESVLDKKSSSSGLSVNELWLLAAFLCDGKIRYSNSKKPENSNIPLNIEFEVSRERKIKHLNALSPEHVYVQKKAYGPLTKTPLTVFRFKYPKYFYKCLSNYKQLSNDFINSLNQEEARIFLQAYTTFDGNANIFNSSIIYSSDKKMVDNLITICVIAGYHPSIRLRDDGSIYTKKDAYTVRFSPEKQYRHIRKHHVQKINYNGKMYCVQVPEGRIIIRSKNKTPLITGNCGTYVGHCLKTAGVEIPKFWMRALAYNDTWGVKLDRPIEGCIVTFSRKGGGHVGFVAGTNKEGQLIVLGGNQNNMVNYATFDKERVVGYYLPKGYNKEGDIPLITSKVEKSLSEA
jgi:uncharacterized protein (TIGR02594 family)